MTFKVRWVSNGTFKVCEHPTTCIWWWKAKSRNKSNSILDYLNYTCAKSHFTTHSCLKVWVGGGGNSPLPTVSTSPLPPLPQCLYFSTITSPPRPLPYCLHFGRLHFPTDFTLPPSFLPLCFPTEFTFPPHLVSLCFNFPTTCSYTSPLLFLAASTSPKFLLPRSLLFPTASTLSKPPLHHRLHFYSSIHKNCRWAVGCSPKNQKKFSKSTYCSLQLETKVFDIHSEATDNFELSNSLKI